ncbi:hypothetical protein [Parachlamydia sp. AcF125]|uniref:hypothetical protein n=1 Tax=Parachlamydia sp. AcF125 TaxID=2795736 RepID=UPI001BC94887|nr:hypothetical protein [Parachlamydia sp. AcF125]MBS4168039.1 hypothetical protein [Parachlamydia sp. AcF125]
MTFSIYCSNNYGNNQFASHLEGNCAKAEKIKCARGNEAAVEMINRPGLSKMVGNFVALQQQNEKEEFSYFTSLIQKKFEPSLPCSLSTEKLDELARSLFASYRVEIVKKLCAEIEVCPQKWNFSSEEWGQKRLSFQDFVWQYIKMDHSSGPQFIINKAIKHTFAVPKEYMPKIHACDLPSEQEDFYPNS